MLPYFAIYFYLSIKSISGSHRLSNISYILVLLFLSLFIGFRYEIGVDWDQYLEIIDRYKDVPFSNVFNNPEPGYIFLSWLGSNFKNGIYLVNVISAAIFSAGLLSYSRNREYPWLSLLIAFPILIVTVAMGYTRQAIAIGIEFFALLEQEKGRNNRAIIFILIASSFHISILPLILIFVKKPNKNFLKIKFIVPATIIGYLVYFVIRTKFEAAIFSYYRVYIAGEFSSMGALYRIFPTFVASLLFIKNRFKFQNYFGETSNLYLKFSYVGLIFLLIIILFPSNSTFIDRFGLYITPLTIFVFTSMLKLKLLKINRMDFKFLMVIIYFAYTFFWLAFAVHAYAWVPYKNFLFI